MRTHRACRVPDTTRVGADAGHDQHPHPPARPLAHALAGRYGYTAEELQHASANTPPDAPGAGYDGDLVETLGVLDRIDTELTEIAGNDRVVEVALTGERQLLSAAVYDLLRHGAAALLEACERFPTGIDDVPDLEQANRHVGEVLRLFRETELVSIQHPDHKSLSCRRTWTIRITDEQADESELTPVAHRLGLQRQLAVTAA